MARKPFENTDDYTECKLEQHAVFSTFFLAEELTNMLGKHKAKTSDVDCEMSHITCRAACTIFRTTQPQASRLRVRCFPFFHFRIYHPSFCNSISWHIVRSLLANGTEPDVIWNTNRPLWHIRFRHGRHSKPKLKPVEFLNWLSDTKGREPATIHYSPLTMHLAFYTKCITNSGRCGVLFLLSNAWHIFTNLPIANGWKIEPCQLWPICVC